jgi:hypothetical protein
MRPCNPANNVILARTLFLLGSEVFNEAETCNIPAKAPAKTKLRRNVSKKTVSTVFGIQPLRSHRNR